MGGKPATGVVIRPEQPRQAAPMNPERKKVPREQSRSRFAGAEKAREEEAALAKKKLLGQ